MKTPLLFVGLIFSLVGCDTTIAANEYRQSCSIDADCVAVFEGGLCGTCGGGCTNAAINLADKAKFDRDATSIRNACPPRLGFSERIACDAAACLERLPFCSAGTCALRP